VPSARIEIEIASLVPSQELLTEGSTGGDLLGRSGCWKRTSAGRSVTSEGYVELTGYAAVWVGFFDG